MSIRPTRTAGLLLFIVSLSTALVWLFGFGADLIFGVDPPLAVLVGSSLAVAVISTAISLRVSPRFLSFERLEAKTVLQLAGWCLAAYTVLVPVFWMLAWLLVSGFGDPSHQEAGMLIAGFALWMPLWWCLPVGLVFAWRRHWSA